MISISGRQHNFSKRNNFCKIGLTGDLIVIGQVGDWSGNLLCICVMQRGEDKGRRKAKAEVEAKEKG
jgi:hypothetical protein